MEKNGLTFTEFKDLLRYIVHCILREFLYTLPQRVYTVVEIAEKYM